MIDLRNSQEMKQKWIFKPKSDKNILSEIIELFAIAIDRKRSRKSRFGKVLEMQADFWTMYQ